MGGRRGGNHTEIEGTTTVVGIIGDAVRGSLSPRLHNAAFAALGLNWCYVAFPVTRDRLGEALRGLPALGIAGVNVTAPHKEAALAYLDETTDEARAIGAVNTIRVASDRLLGHNTDTAGLLDALSCDGGLAVEGRRCVIVGAGGAARAAAFALAGAGAAGITIITAIGIAPPRWPAPYGGLFPVPLTQRRSTDRELRPRCARPPCSCRPPPSAAGRSAR